MKAAVIRKYGRIALEDAPKPELKDGNVLIRVKYASICGSDQHIFRGGVSSQNNTAAYCRA